MDSIPADARRVKYDFAHSHLTGHPISGNGNVSGFYMPERHEYYRRIVGSRHLLRKPPAITNDLAALTEAERLGADRVRIVDSETGIEYLCASLTIREYGFYLDRGHGKQIALPLPYWTQCAPDGTITQPTLPKQKPQPQPQPEAEQPMLFDMPAERRGGSY